MASTLTRRISPISSRVISASACTLCTDATPCAAGRAGQGWAANVGWLAGRERLATCVASARPAWHRRTGVPTRQPCFCAMRRCTGPPSSEHAWGAQDRRSGQGGHASVFGYPAGQARRRAAPVASPRGTAAVPTVAIPRPRQAAPGSHLLLLVLKRQKGAQLRLGGRLALRRLAQLRLQALRRRLQDAGLRRGGAPEHTQTRGFDLGQRPAGFGGQVSHLHARIQQGTAHRTLAWRCAEESCALASLQPWSAAFFSEVSACGRGAGMRCQCSAAQQTGPAASIPGHNTRASPPAALPCAAPGASNPHRDARLQPGQLPHGSCQLRFCGCGRLQRPCRLGPRLASLLPGLPAGWRLCVCVCARESTFAYLRFDGT